MEDEEMKNEVTQDEIFAMVQQFRKGVKERRVYAGTVVQVITTAEIARMTNKRQQLDRRWSMEESERKQGRQRCKQRMGASKSNWNSWENNGERRQRTSAARPVVSPKRGKARTNRVIGTHKHGKGKSSTKGSSKGSIYSVDIDWWAQSDGSQHSSRSEEEIHLRAKCRIMHQ